MRKETSINFLLFSYFGITLDSGNNEMIEAAIDRAYRDASSRVLSVNPPKEALKELTEKGKENLKRELRERLKKAGKTELMYFIKTIQSQVQPPESYDTLHQDVCNKLVKCYEEEPAEDRTFTYGIAQKWVNMTMKYLCVIGSVLEQYKQEHPFYAAYKEKLSHLEPYLHVPVDGYIMEAAVAGEEKDGQKFSYGLEVALPRGDKPPVKSLSSATCWSKWDYDGYIKFQETLKEKCREKWETPLEWENEAWIEIAKKRKEKEQKKNKKT